MILLVAVALVILSVPWLGGDLSRAAELRLRWGPLLVAALSLQILVINVAPRALPHAASSAVHLASYALVAVFVGANRRVSGLWLVALGGLLNLAAIAVNGGVMPASPTAMGAAGIEVEHEAFSNSGAVDDTRLTFLGDVFSTPDELPLANVFSIGDVLLVIGAAAVLHTACGTRLARPAKASGTLPTGVAGVDGDGLRARSNLPGERVRHQGASAGQTGRRPTGVRPLQVGDHQAQEGRGRQGSGQAVRQAHPPSGGCGP